MPLLPRDAARKIAVIIAGRIDDSIRDGIVARAEQLTRQQPELALHLDERWLASGEIEALISASDVVLAPYQRFVGSSGVLMWAARAGKPVLAPEFGLIGRLVADHRLGLALDTEDPRAIADGIARMVGEGAHRFIDARLAQSFTGTRTPQRFAAAVFFSLFGEVRSTERRRDIGSSIGHEAAST